MNIVYKAKKQFKYNGEMLKPGDVWEAVGGKWDVQIKEHLVYAEEVEPEQKAVKRDNRRK